MSIYSKELGIYLTIPFFIHFVSIVNGKCTKNPEFDEIYSPKKALLCSLMERQCKRDYLTKNMEYKYCQQTNSNSEKAFAIGIVNDTTVPYKFIKCLNTDGWNQNVPCQPKRNVVRFVPTTLTRLEHYVVICGDENSLTQFPNEDQVQIQIRMIKNKDDYDRFNSNNMNLLHATTMIPCIAHCMESTPIYTTRPLVNQPFNDIDPNNMALLRLYSKQPPPNPTPPKKFHSYIIEYNCSSPNVESWTLRFAVANKYDPIYVNQYTNVQDGSVLDAGDDVACHYKASLDYPKENVSIISMVDLSTTHPYLSYINSNNELVNVTSVNQKLTVMVPENLKRGHSYTLNCYLGFWEHRNKNHNDNRYYFELKKSQVTIGSTYKTVYTYHDNSIIIDNYVEDLSILKCNTDYYKKMSLKNNIKVKIGILYAKEMSVPYSRMLINSSIEKITSSNETMYFKRRQTGVMALYCMIDNEYSTPIVLVSGSFAMLKEFPLAYSVKSLTTMFNIFPEWNSKFALRNFVYGCYGENMVEAFIKCVNCTVDYIIEGIDNGTYPYLVIPFDIRRDAVLEFVCTGRGVNFTVTNSRMVLHIISYDYNDFNDTYPFFMEDDMFNCAARFETNNGNDIIHHRLAMPTELSIDGIVMRTTHNIKQLRLKGGAKLYKGCCLAYINNSITCNENWKTLKIGVNFTYKWSMDLKQVYPKNSIRCFACVSYISKTMKTCENEHKIRAFIGIKIIKPDGGQERVDCSDQKYVVKVPDQMMKADKISFYTMSRFRVKVSCCIRDKVFSANINIRSCDENPPPILIFPPDKMLFEVGESFSCTTDMVECKDHLLYRVSIAKEGNNPMVFETQTFEFTSAYTGNKIEIKCIVGSINQQYDSRIIRIEQSPNNVTITGLLPILWYGRFLQCSASGFPPPDIFWIQINGSSLLRISEYFLLIGPWDFSGNYTVICEAKNSRGTASKTVTFGNYNSRITYYESSEMFYLIIPFLTLLFLILIIGSTLLTFQEVFFGVPFFSSCKANEMMINRAKRTKNIYTL